MRACAAGVWLLAVLGVAPEARALPPLSWDAPEGCPDTVSVEARLDRLVGAAAGRDVTRIQMTASPDAEEGWRLRVSIEWAEAADQTMSGDATSSLAERELAGPTCAAVAEAGAVVVALAIDAWEQRRVEVVAERTPAPETAPAEGPEHEVFGAIIAGGRLDVGALPSPRAGLAAGVALQRDALRVELHGALFPGARSSLQAHPGVGGELRWWTIEGRGCGLPLRGRVDLALCGTLAAGRVKGEGFGVSFPMSGTANWLAPGASVAATLHLGRTLGFRGELGLAVPLHRPRFVLEGLGQLHRSAAVDVAGGLALEARFP